MLGREVTAGVAGDVWEAVGAGGGLILPQEYWKPFL